MVGEKPGNEVVNLSYSRKTKKQMAVNLKKKSE
jgi:hypothetical protein